MSTPLTVTVPVTHQPLEAHHVKGPKSVALKYAKKAIKGIGEGILVGLTFYGSAWVVRKIGLDKSSGKLHPLPYILTGIASALILTTTSAIYNLFLHALGKREIYENLAHPEKASLANKLRHHTWKMVTRIEKIQHKIDVLFSRLFKIRTAKEIREKKIANYHLSDMEIFRRCVLEQIPTTLKCIIPFKLGASITRAAGFKMLPGFGICVEAGFHFIGGIFMNYLSIQAENKEENKNNKRLNQVKCVLVTA